MPESFFVEKLIRKCLHFTFFRIERVIFGEDFSKMSRVLKIMHKSALGREECWEVFVKSNGKTLPWILFFLKYCFISSNSEVLMSDA